MSDSRQTFPPLSGQTREVSHTTSPRSIDLACLAVVTIYGVNFVVIKQALQRFDVATFNVVRFTIMVSLGWMLLAINHRRRGDAWLPERGDWARIALAGGIGFFGFLYGFTVGLRHTSAFSSALLTAMSSLFVALLLWVTGAETLGRRHVAGLVLAFGGAVLFVVGRSSGQVQLKPGDAITLGAAFLYAAYLVINRPLTSKYPALSLTTWSMTVAYGVVLVVGGPFVHRQDWARVNAGAWLSMVWAVTLPVFISWSVWAWANAQVGAARPALFLVLVPVVSGVTAWWMLDERIHALQIVGVALVVAALLAGRSRPARPVLAR